MALPLAKTWANGQPRKPDGRRSTSMDGFRPPMEKLHPLA